MSVGGRSIAEDIYTFWFHEEVISDKQNIPISLTAATVLQCKTNKIEENIYGIYE